MLVEELEAFKDKDQLIRALKLCKEGGGYGRWRCCSSAAGCGCRGAVLVLAAGMDRMPPLP